MKHQMKLAVGALALSGALVGGGAAAAWAQTSTPSTSTPSTTAPADPGTTTTPKAAPKSSANCPNMGNNSDSGTAPSASSSSYPGV